MRKLNLIAFLITNAHNTLCNNMSKLWSSTLFGESEFPQYDPNIETKRQLNGAIERAEPKGNRKGIMKGLVKQGLREHKLEEKAQETRKKTSCRVSFTRDFRV